MGKGKINVERGEGTERRFKNEEMVLWWSETLLSQGGQENRAEREREEYFSKMGRFVARREIHGGILAVNGLW